MASMVFNGVPTSATRVRRCETPYLAEVRASETCIYIYIYIYICIYMHICIYIYSLIADSSDKGSDRRQKKNNIESKGTLQILSAADSKGENIGARKLRHHNVPTIVRNGRFARPDHRSAVTTR